jgi:nucleotide-binding universal stress UspA family protein
MSAVDSPGAGPILLAYDGSELARRAIEEAAGLLNPAREALVLCVWQPFDLGFAPIDDTALDAKDPKQVSVAAERTAAAGAAIATAAGFTQARPLALEASPVWQGIVDSAEEHAASVIVLGSHGHSGLGALIVGSVARAVADHSRRTVLIAHPQG